MLSLTNCLLLIVHELTPLGLKLHVSLPLLEELCLFDSFALAYCCLSELAESAKSRLQHAKLAAQTLQEVLHLARDDILWHFALIVETDLNDCLGSSERATDWVVENVGKLFVCDRSDLIRLQAALLVIDSKLRQLRVRVLGQHERVSFESLAALRVACICLVRICIDGLVGVRGAGKFKHTS